MFVTAIQQHVIAGCMLSLIGCALPAFSQTTVPQNGYVTFEVPNAQDTIPSAMNNFLGVTGSYSGTEPVGFVRDVAGNVSTLAPTYCMRTWPTAINDTGIVVGFCEPHGGFMRDVLGNITWLDCPGTANSTDPFSINLAGAIAGTCAGHGFVRSAQGVFTTFDVPGSTQTYGFRINAAGVVAGTWSDANNVDHGFLRHADGTFSVFNLPGRTPGWGFGLVPFGLNAAGAVAGTWVDTNQVSHGFLRAANGTVTSFDFPGSTSTTAYGINAAGVIAGYYSDKNSVFHGFTRGPQGSFTSFDPPGSTGTIAVAINDWGIITGHYGNNQAHIGAAGFLSGVPSYLAQPGVYTVTDSRGLYVDGGFALYGDQTVRLWVYVAGNPAQRWTFAQVSDGLTLQNDATSEFATDGGGTLVERISMGLPDSWTITPLASGFTIKNNRTGLYMTDPEVQNGAILLTPTPSIWQISTPR